MGSNILQSYGICGVSGLTLVLYLGHNGSFSATPYGKFRAISRGDTGACLGDTAACHETWWHIAACHGFAWHMPCRAAVYYEISRYVPCLDMPRQAAACHGTCVTVYHDISRHIPRDAPTCRGMPRHRMGHAMGTHDVTWHVPRRVAKSTIISDKVRP